MVNTLIFLMMLLGSFFLAAIVANISDDCDKNFLLYS